MRPYISWACDVDEVIGVRDRYMVYRRSNRECIVRLELDALYKDGKLTETSFADISTDKSWKCFFEKVTSWRNQQFIDNEKIDKEACLKASTRLKEFLVGTRGDWWPPYCARITRGDAVNARQRGGYKGGTQFGERLRELYGRQAIPPMPSRAPPSDAAHNSASTAAPSSRLPQPRTATTDTAPPPAKQQRMAGSSTDPATLAAEGRDSLTTAAAVTSSEKQKCAGLKHEPIIEPQCPSMNYKTQDPVSGEAATASRKKATPLPQLESRSRRKRRLQLYKPQTQ